MRAKMKVLRNLRDLRSTSKVDAPASGAREWTGEIRSGGTTLFAARAYHAKFDAFATDVLGHARLFASDTEVEEWAKRLKIPGVTPVRVRDGQVIRTDGSQG